MVVVSGPCPFIYNLVVVHCSTRHRHHCNGTRTSPVQTTCNHATWNFTPRVMAQSCWPALLACLSWDIQVWLTARPGRIQPLALDQPGILAQRCVTNFTRHSLSRGLDSSTPLSREQGQICDAELRWVQPGCCPRTTTRGCSVYIQESLVWIRPVSTKRFRCDTAQGFWTPDSRSGNHSAHTTLNF